MKHIYILLISFLLVTSCTSDLDQFPTNIASSNSLTDFEGALNAAYFYNRGSVTPMAVMGDFRSDNALMDEEPNTEFDKFGPNLIDMGPQFFNPFYSALYKAILSTNTVIEKSTDPVEIGEAKFLRALAYFKLVRVFGDVPINLSSTPSLTDGSILARQPVSNVYAQIISDLNDAAGALSTNIVNGRASKLAAQGMLGKVFMQMSDFGSALAPLQAVVDGAGGAGIALQEDFANIFGVDNDLNSEIIFASQISSSIADEYTSSEFWSWFGGLDTKSLNPVDQDLVAAFDASAANGGGTDLRRAVTINEAGTASPKYPQTGGPDHDWIEQRLGGAILLYAEALNETGNSAGALDQLNKIRTRAGLTNSTATSQAEVRQAIADERRLELAFEGQRWFDLVRTGTVDAEMGETIDSRYHLFPIPNSEVLSSFGVITQNPGY